MHVVSALLKSMSDIGICEKHSVLKSCFLAVMPRILLCNLTV